MQQANQLRDGLKELAIYLRPGLAGRGPDIPRAVKRDVIDTCGPVCALCGRGADALHHVFPRREARVIFKGDPHVPQNLIPVCDSCHGAADEDAIIPRGRLFLKRNRIVPLNDQNLRTIEVAGTRIVYFDLFRNAPIGEQYRLEHIATHLDTYRKNRVAWCRHSLNRMLLETRNQPYQLLELYGMLRKCDAPMALNPTLQEILRHRLTDPMMLASFAYQRMYALGLVAGLQADNAAARGELVRSLSAVADEAIDRYADCDDTVGLEIVTFNRLAFLHQFSEEDRGEFLDRVSNLTSTARLGGVYESPEAFFWQKNLLVYRCYSLLWKKRYQEALELCESALRTLDVPGAPTNRFFYAMAGYTGVKIFQESLSNRRSFELLKRSLDALSCAWWIVCESGDSENVGETACWFAEALCTIDRGDWAKEVLQHFLRNYQSRFACQSNHLAKRRALHMLAGLLRRPTETVLNSGSFRELRDCARERRARL